MTPEQFRTLARYNRWANGRLFAACARLGQDELARPRPCFFGSILATLNHGLVGDRLWMGRFEGTPCADIVSLDQILHPDFDGLVAAREAFDQHIVDFFNRFDGRLDRPFRYRTMAGEESQTHMGWAVLHMFNHGTHHRGQVHTLLSSTSAEPPSLDLLYYLRECPPA